MKIALLFLLVLCALARGAPYLVCDPYPANTEGGLNVGVFVINGLSANAITSNAVIASDGSQSLHYDLGQTALTNGTQYTISVYAVNDYGIAGNPATLVFTKGVPAPPGNLRISAQ